MRTSLIVTFAAAVAQAFAPAAVSSRRHPPATTELAMERRHLFAAAGLVVGLATWMPQQAAHASHGSTFFYDDQIEKQRVEPSQMHTGNKIDLNSAFVGEYKQLPGFFPHAAGMVSSHGPYNSVADIYKIPGLTENDKVLFKKYEKEFTANPPGRAFAERINARVST